MQMYIFVSFNVDFHIIETFNLQIIHIVSASSPLLIYDVYL